MIATRASLISGIVTAWPASRQHLRALRGACPSNGPTTIESSMENRTPGFRLTFLTGSRAPPAIAASTKLKYPGLG